MSDKQKRLLAMLQKRKDDLAAPSIVPVAPIKPAPKAAEADITATIKKSRPANSPAAPASTGSASSASAAAASKPKGAFVTSLPSLSVVSAARAPVAAAAAAPTADAASRKRPVPDSHTAKSSNSNNANKAGAAAAARPASSHSITSATPPPRKGGMSALQSKMEVQLQGGQFRWLNEQLYTTNSTQAVALMSKDPELFEAYHEGFRHQVTKWPSNPVDIFIRHIKTLSPRAVIGDFGCGDAMIARSVPQTVHSFDLVSVNERVVACDIRSVPLKNAVLDVAIFSLALMGTNFTDFIKEAHRTLKINGQLKIAEVRSRFDEQHDGIERFIKAVTEIGFRHRHTDKSNTHFVLLDFIKCTDATGTVTPAGMLLKPCIYKRR